MLVKRISNIEERIDRLLRGAVFAECCKIGQLNNEVLGYPFKITRHTPFVPCVVSQTHQLEPNVDISMPMLRVCISFKHNECDCHTNLPNALEVVAGKSLMKKIYAYDGEDIPPPSEAGWVDSRFYCVDDEAIQRYIDSIFKDSSFSVMYYTDYFDEPVFSITSKGRVKKDSNLPTYLAQIPKIIAAFRHKSVACISKIDISEEPSPGIDAQIQNIQKARNLPEGAQKEDEHDHVALSKRRFMDRIPEVFLFLESKGYDM